VGLSTDSNVGYYSFEEALTGRVVNMLDACTKCGACFTACPIVAPAGLGGADPKAVGLGCA
jgi:heterodisulfide reductase subunit D